MFSYISYDKQHHVVRITIIRPEVLNALNDPASSELSEAWDQFIADDDAWVAVLTGSGERAFCAGNDLKYIATLSPDVTALPIHMRPTFPRTGFGGLTNRTDILKPIIARVNGLALGGGFELVLACDLVIASETAQFGFPEVRRGAVAVAGGVFRLPRQIGLKPAMGLLLSGEPIPAAQALNLGIVNEVVPPERLDEAVDRWLGSLLASSPLALYATKQAVTEGLEMNLSTAMEHEFTWERARLASQDSREGVQAFVEKRPPVWLGK